MSNHDRISSRPRELSRRDFLKLSASTAAGLFLASCAPAVAPATTAPASSGIKANLSTLHLGYDNPNWSHQVADYVAREKGWFKDVGIDNSDFIVFDDSLTAIIGKGVDLTAADTDATMAAHLDKGVDVWYLGTRRGEEDMLLGLAPGVTVESLKGSGKSCSGGTVGSRNELLSKFMIKDMGLDPEKDVSWITMGGGSDTRLAALINGNLSCSMIQIRHIKQLTEAGGTVAYKKRRKIAQDGYVAMGPFLKTNYDTVVAFLTGIIKAKQYIKNLDTKDEVIAIMEKNGFEFNQEFKDTYAEGIAVLSPDCGFDIQDMDALWTELAKTGDAPADFPWRKGVNLEPLWKAQEANGLPRRPASL
jgi:ABC-type nitrate/sulfonate/bicarbonate transport system substrate-binding protein